MRRPVLLFLLLAATTLTQAQLSFQQSMISASNAGRILRADVNNDGIPDLILYAGNNYRWGSPGAGVAVYLNNGTGDFSAGAQYTLASPVEKAGTGDVNLDGNIDIATCSQSNGFATLTMLMGRGDGTFSTGYSRSTTHANCAGLIVADVNGDGIPDVVMATFDYGSNLSYVDVFLFSSSGSASFNEQTTDLTDTSWNIPCWFEDMTGAQFFVHARIDIIASSNCDTTGYSSGELWKGVNNGTGRFTWTKLETGVGLVHQMRVADINQDGLPDVVATVYDDTHESQGSWLMQIFNKGDGTVYSTTLFDNDCQDCSDYSGGYLNASAIGDFDGDGVKDGAGGELEYTNGVPAYMIAFVLGSGTGSFTVNQQVDYPADTPLDMVSGDFDRDGRPDLVLLGQNGIHVFLNRTPSAPECSAQSPLRTVSLCFASTTNGQVHLLANTTDNRTVQAMKVYIDGVSSFLTTDDLLNHVFNFAAGTHRVTAKAWDALGSFSTTQYVTVDAVYTGCNNPGNRTVLICSPQNGTVVSSPVTVQASVATSLKYYAAKVYVDGTSVYQTVSKSIDTQLTMSSGTHRITVKAWDSSGSFSQSISITVR